MRTRLVSQREQHHPSVREEANVFPGARELIVSPFGFCEAKVRVGKMGNYRSAREQLGENPLISIVRGGPASEAELARIVHSGSWRGLYASRQIE